MRIAYVTTYDPADVRYWSGLGTYIHNSLSGQGCQVEFLGPLPQYSGLRRHWLRATSVWYNRLLRGSLGNFSTERDLNAARFYAQVVMERMQGKHYDLIVSPGAIPVAFVRSDVPLVIWADATFDSLITTYPAYSKMTRGYYRDGEKLEREAFGRAALCIFSSDWAAQSAIVHYGIPEQKVKVIPFGANLNDPDDDVKAALDQRAADKVKLLFVGYDFERKGGPKIFGVLEALLGLQVPAELHIIGCSPEPPDLLRPHVRVHGVVSKKTADGRRELVQAFQSSHWLLLLSQAECYGLVLAEANRYGVPCIGNQVGGIPTIIKDDCNGKLFPVDAAPLEIARYIAAVSRDRDRYLQMAAAAEQEYRTRLNWRVAGSAFVACVRQLVPKVASTGPFA